MPRQPPHALTPQPCCPLQVGRVRTEEAILSSVDHPFLATLYGTLQTGGAGRGGTALVGVQEGALARPACPCQR